MLTELNLIKIELTDPTNKLKFSSSTLEATKEELQDYTDLHNLKYTKTAPQKKTA